MLSRGNYFKNRRKFTSVKALQRQQKDKLICWRKQNLTRPSKVNSPSKKISSRTSQRHENGSEAWTIRIQLTSFRILERPAFCFLCFLRLGESVEKDGRIWKTWKWGEQRTGIMSAESYVHERVPEMSVVPESSRLPLTEMALPPITQHI